MVFDEGDQLRSDQEERRREKFSRERGGGDYMDRGGRRNFGMERRDFNGVAKKRPFRDDDFPADKRSRYDGAVDSYEPQFIRKDGEEFSASNAVPQLLTFKKFLATQDETLSDEDAKTKYEDYKLEFMKQECERFFQAHKEEEWFRQKYHPEEGKQRREDQRQNLQKRLEIFKEFMTAGRFDDLEMNWENAEKIIRLMDAAVIKLEGGTETDLEMASQEPLFDESVLDLLLAEELKKREALKREQELQENRKTAAKPNEEDDTKTAIAGTEEEMDPTKANESGKLKQSKPHKTCSIHFRSIPSTVPLADIENLCKQHPGFLRLCVTDPSPNRGNLRSAWATYRWDVNIQQIFWALRAAKLEGHDLDVSVNRELKRRVRTVGETTGLTAHRPVMKQDIRNAAKLVVLYDMKACLFSEEVEEGEDQAQGGEQDEVRLANLEAAVLNSRNPVLEGIEQFLVEETNAEEETVLEKVSVANNTDIMQEYEVDSQLAKTLDLTVLYLRIVHSVDFYAGIEYQAEDDMPHRMGIVHVRGRPPIGFPTTMRGIQLLPKSIVEAHITASNQRLQAGLLKKVVISEAELQKLGKKDAEKAAEDYINNNTMQLAPDKWLCPLSGKKFKGPEFVHKHIHSKYAKEIENARYEALYFNTYLADPNRPHNPIFAKSPNQHNSSMAERERSHSPTTRPRRSSGGMGSGAADDVGGRQVAEASERYPRPTWQSSAGDRFSGGNRYGGGGGRSFGNFGSGAGGRPQRNFYEPVNEMNAPVGGGRKDPRAPPSYRDLDAPTEEIP